MIKWGLNRFGNILFSAPDARTVLIRADHRRRDAASSLLIGYYLKDLGYNVVVANRLSARTWYHFFRPEAVLNSHPDAMFSPRELEEESKHCRFVLMHPESSGMIRRAMVMAMQGGEGRGRTFAEHYSKVLTWGPVLKDWVVDEGLYSEEIVEDVGCARYDFYRSMQRRTADKQTLGAMSSFTGISIYDRRNVFENICNNRMMRGIHFGEKGGFEDFLWMSAAFVRLFMEFLDVWCLELKNPVHFRPYTLESLEDHVFFRKRYGKHLYIDTLSPFPQWLSQHYANVFCFSSSVIESIISGVPYITLQGVIEDRLEYHQPRAEFPETRGEIYEHTYQPNSIAEVVELAKKARRGDLGLRTTPQQSPRLRKLLWDYYGWPRPQPTSQIVAQKIDEVLLDTPLNHSNSRWQFLKELSKGPARAWSHSGKGRLWRTFNDYHFMPWHAQEKRYAYRHWRNLLANPRITGTDMTEEESSAEKVRG